MDKQMNGPTKEWTNEIRNQGVTGQTNHWTSQRMDQRMKELTNE